MQTRPPEWMRQGTDCLRSGRFAEALDCFKRILAADPAHAAALYNSGAALQGLGRLDEALVLYARLLSLAPAHDGALANSGIALSEQGRAAEALACFERALTINPGLLRARVGKAMAQDALGQAAVAIQSLQEALRLAPGDAGILNNLGLLLSRSGRLEEALHSLREAEAGAPGSAYIRGNIAAVLLKLGRPEQALPLYANLAAAFPADAEIHCQLGAALAATGQAQRALSSFDHALTLHPGHAVATYNRGLELLAMGKLRDGFAAHEARWRIEPFSQQVFATAAPLWTGRQPIAGRTVLLHHEQGYGDTVQFARYAPLLGRAGARVILRVPAALCGLLRSLADVAEVISDREPAPPHDLHCPMLSLPLAFDTRLETIPAQLPYLHADPARVAWWAGQLGPRRRMRIGLVWAGRQQAPLNYARDLPLFRLRPLLDLDADFLSLQKDIPAADRAFLSQSGIAPWGERLADFADAAALAANLDLLVSADTAMAHVVAATGGEVWVMNRFAPCWRWLRDRDDSPWYPGLRLFRQERFGEWDPVVSRLRQALGERLRGPR
jgi:tetratricopeptide (TPR) repeat protein